MARDQARESEALQARAAPSDPAPAASLFLSPEQISAARRERRVDPNHQLQIELAALTAGELVARLGEHGVETEEKAFLALAKTKETAWAIGEEVWLVDAAEEMSSDQRELICLAACELWKRWVPDQPSPAARCEWIERGYQRKRVDDFAGACDAWLPLWTRLRPLLTPRMREMKMADALLGGDYFMLNWTQDLCEALRNAALDEPKYAAPGVSFCEQVIVQFPDEALTVDHFRCDLADFFALEGKRGEAEAILRELIERRPDDAIGYVQLAEVLTLRSDDAADRARAAALLEQALARPVVDPEDWDLEARLEGYRS